MLMVGVGGWVGGGVMRWDVGFGSGEGMTCLGSAWTGTVFDNTNDLPLRRRPRSFSFDALVDRLLDKDRIEYC